MKPSLGQNLRTWINQQRHLAWKWHLQAKVFHQAWREHWGGARSRLARIFSQTNGRVPCNGPSLILQRPNRIPYPGTHPTFFWKCSSQNRDSKASRVFKVLDSKHLGKRKKDEREGTQDASLEVLRRDQLSLTFV